MAHESLYSCAYSRERAWNAENLSWASFVIEKWQLKGITAAFFIININSLVKAIWINYQRGKKAFLPDH